MGTPHDPRAGDTGFGIRASRAVAVISVFANGDCNRQIFDLRRSVGEGAGGSAGSVDVGAVIDAHDSDRGVVVVDLVDDAIGTAPGGPQASQLPLQRMPNAAGSFEECSNHELDNGGGHPLG